MFIIVLTFLQTLLFTSVVGGLTITTVEYQECKSKDFKGSVEVAGNFANCKDLKRFSKFDKENR